MKHWPIIPFFLLASACAPKTSPTPPTPTVPVTSEIVLRAQSCASGTLRYEPSPITIHVSEVSLGADADIQKAIPSNVSFSGGWHLTSVDPNFGGLSGLALTESGDLLAVSDRGFLVSINLETGTPTGEAALMPLLGSDGAALNGKKDGDAEGLAYRHGGAYISFERNHRILFYDFERCGVAARGTLFSGLPKDVLTTNIKANDGAEALDFDTNGHVRAGYETVINGQAPLVSFDPDGIARTAPKFVVVEDDFKLVGADAGFLLFRAYDSQIGNRNIISSSATDFRLTPPLAVDNFEGIAVQRLADGTTHLYLISDDNFSARQRTLLYRFEIAP